VEPLDPSLQDETFASTLSGIEDLRRNFGSHEHDWARYKISVVNAIRSGARLEQEVVDLQVAVNSCSRRGAVAAIAERVKALEDVANRRRGVWRWLVDHFWQIIVVVLAAELARRWR
jgi:hypothetical protein